MKRSVKKAPKKALKSSGYDQNKKVMLALVIDRPLHKKLFSEVREQRTSMREYVTGLIERAVK